MDTPAIKELSYNLMIKLVTHNIEQLSYEKGIKEIKEVINEEKEIVGLHVWNEKESCFYTTHYKIKDKIKH